MITFYCLHASLNDALAYVCTPLQERHNERDDCWFRRRSKETSKLRVTGELPAQRASNAENVSIWWRHHASGVDEIKIVNLGLTVGYYLIDLFTSWSRHCPAGTRHNNNVFITSKRRRRRRFDVMKTLSLRHYCVMCPLGGGNITKVTCNKRALLDWDAMCIFRYHGYIHNVDSWFLISASYLTHRHHP